MTRGHGHETLRVESALFQESWIHDSLVGRFTNGSGVGNETQEGAIGIPDARTND